MLGFVREIDISESDYPLTSVKVVMNLGFRIVIVGRRCFTLISHFVAGKYPVTPKRCSRAARYGDAPSKTFYLLAVIYLEDVHPHWERSNALPQ